MSEPYTLVYSSSNKDFVTEVNEALAKGYVFAGPLHVVWNNEKMFRYQPMILASHEHLIRHIVPQPSEPQLRKITIQHETRAERPVESEPREGHT